MFGGLGVLVLRDFNLLRCFDDRLQTILLTTSIEKSEIVEALLLGSRGIVPKQSATSPKRSRSANTRIYDKLGVNNRVELAMFAINHDLIKQLADKP